MPLSWNEIRSRAIKFSREFADATRENSETQTFYNEFFNVFGISRRRIASFEEPVKKLGDKKGRIDLFWKGTLLIEQKSKGRDLGKAYVQALDYFPHLKEEELPRYILVSDFQNFELFDLETKTETKFQLKDLHKNVEHFGFIAGYQKREFKDQDPVNIQASELMGKLHDMLKDAGYKGHQLELFLVRLLFCLFADDTNIFEKDVFKFYIEENTKPDGSDLGNHLAHLFQILNTPADERQKNINPDLALFPYVNGKLFEEILPITTFDSAMRQALLTACGFNWSYISPAIFGSLFQSVMDKNKRRGIGAHYTTEQNIMKIIKPLFLDELYEEFAKGKGSKAKMLALHDKLAKLKFLDPACGCGNFLILAYRELRILEIELLKALYGQQQQVLDVSQFSSRIDVDAFYGFEVEEFPARIAEVAMWLIDHQMNMRLSEAFGQYFVRIPLRKSAQIVHGNALRMDWKQVIDPKDLSYILGNPPFVGKKEQKAEQKSDMQLIFSGVTGNGVLDYVTAWYIKAAQYIQGTQIKCAFVSTNSISQGEQVGILWNELFNKYHIKIHFAHRTFAWGSEAKGKAAVHCVIIGFANFDTTNKLLYDYETPKSEAHEIVVKNINPYLVDTRDTLVISRNSPISGCPDISYGSFALDDGNYTLTPNERDEILKDYPTASEYIRPFIGGQELLYGEKRYCLWLSGAEPHVIQAIKPITQRIEAVRNWRLKSNRMNTKKLATTPSIFAEIRQPDSRYLALPTLSSERRTYIPIVFLSADIVASNQIYIVPNASLFHFGVMTSIMHMAWIKYVCGKLESRYRYSVGIVYNNFPWPREPTPAQKYAIEEKAQTILDARAKFPNSSLADLYDPLTMPPELLKAHQALDKAVDAAYRKQPFENELSRIEFLFNLYQEYTAPLEQQAKARKKN